ncbi:MAG: riboflavin kinase [Patescibacteria group bacterium]
MRLITISGTVISGEQIGERQGYPTANFSRHVLRRSGLGNGIYIASITIGTRWYRAVAVIGVPGVRVQRRGKVELYIIDYPRRELYGRRLQFVVYKKIRPIRRYRQSADLMARIRADIRAARKFHYPSRATRGNI